jgi:hypothetical protein
MRKDTSPRLLRFLALISMKCPPDAKRELHLFTVPLTNDFCRNAVSARTTERSFMRLVQAAVSVLKTRRSRRTPCGTGQGLKNPAIFGGLCSLA